MERQRYVVSDAEKLPKTCTPLLKKQKQKQTSKICLNNNMIYLYFIFPIENSQWSPLGHKRVHHQNMAMNIEISTFPVNRNSHDRPWIDAYVISTNKSSGAKQMFQYQENSPYASVGTWWVISYWAFPARTVVQNPSFISKWFFVYAVILFKPRQQDFQSTSAVLVSVSKISTDLVICTWIGYCQPNC